MSGPMWVGQVWGPSHSRTSPRRQPLSLFRSFRGIGISDHQPCKKSSEENGSPGLHATTISGHRRRVCAGPSTGPFGLEPRARDIRGLRRADPACILSAIIMKEQRPVSIKLTCQSPRTTGNSCFKKLDWESFEVFV